MTAQIHGLEIEVIVESPSWEARPEAENIVCAALGQAADVIGTDFRNCMVAVLLTDDAAMRRLNAQWRDIDKPTNVLSFPAAPQLARGEDEAKPLGDIAISYETTTREAREEHKEFVHHLAHLTVHGFLHLLGYDHETDSQAETMEQLERAVLRRFGIPDPYLTHEIEA
jgi:probable rRNA maturation factor